MYMHEGPLKSVQHLHFYGIIIILYSIVKKCCIPPLTELGIFTEPDFLLYDYLSKVYRLFYNHGNATYTA